MAKFIDTFKTFFNQELGKKGLIGTQENPLQQKALMSLGGFEAPVWTRDRSQIWMADQQSTVNPNSFTRNEVARITRYLVNNAPLFERILTITETYAIGEGLSATAVTDDPIFNKANTIAFNNWASTQFCFANQMYNFYEAQKLMARELIIAGELFIVMIKSPSGYPQLMLVPTENVKNSGEVGDDSVDGLFVDDFGRVTAYMVFFGEKGQKIDASNVIHLMRHKNIGQLRGIGSFAASLNSMRDYKDMQVLEKRAMKVHSALAAVVEKKAGEAAQGIFGGVSQSDGLGNPLLKEQITAGTPTNTGLERAFGGNVVYVEPGEKVNLVSSERSNEGFFKFMEMLLRDVCQNISLPYEFVVNADKMTGVGIRFILGDASSFFLHIQSMILDGAIQRIYGWVTASFIKSNKVPAPVGDLPWGASFTKPISITVDQTRVSNTEIALMSNSMSNYQTFWGARGKDWRQELEQKAQEEAFLDELSDKYEIPVARLRNLPAGTVLLPAQRDVVNEDATQGEQTDQKEDK